MHPISRRTLLLASALMFGLPRVGIAADATQDQARAVAEQLRGFVSGVLGDKVPLAPDLLTVTPAGDGFTVTLQSAMAAISRLDDSGKPTTAWLTAVIRPDEGTRWRIDSLKFPASINLSPDTATTLASTMAPKVSRADADQPMADKSDPAPVPSMAVQMGTQSGSGVFDTAQTSESHLDFRVDGLRYEARNIGGVAESRTTIDRMAGRYWLRPTASGAVDYLGEGTLDSYAAVSDNPAIGTVRVTARHIAARGETGAVVLGQVATLIRTAVTLGADAAAADHQAPDAKETSDRLARAAMPTLIAALKGIMTGAKLDETVDGLDVQAVNGHFSADKVGMAFGAEAPHDTFAAFLELGAAGLNIQGLPPESADFVPRSFVIRPTVANIDLKALTQLATDASAEGADPEAMKARLAALFTTTGVRIGFDHLDMDLGYASMTGVGDATIVGPTAVRGTADIAITGLDALMQHAQALPNAAQAMGVLALAKGFGKAQGDKTTWHIAFSEDNKVLVNGIDLSKMGGK